MTVVACFVVNGVTCGFIGDFGSIQNAFVVIVDNLLSVIHASVADLDGVAIEDFSKLVVLREVFVI